MTGELLSYGQANGLLKAAPTHLAAREVRDFTVPYLVTRGAYAEILDGEMVGHSAHAGVSLGRTIQSRCADGWTSEDRWANWMEPAYRGVPVTFYRW